MDHHLLNLLQFLQQCAISLHYHLLFHFFRVGLFSVLVLFPIFPILLFPILLQQMHTIRLFCGIHRIDSTQ